MGLLSALAKLKNVPEAALAPYLERAKQIEAMKAQYPLNRVELENRALYSASMPEEELKVLQDLERRQQDALMALMQPDAELKGYRESFDELEPEIFRMLKELEDK